eukprot:UN13239
MQKLAKMTDFHYFHLHYPWKCTFHGNRTMEHV